MKRLIILIVLLLSPIVRADMTTINQKGQTVDIDSHLTPNVENIVVFHHKATYLSYQLYQSLVKLAAKSPQIPILIVDCPRPDCPAAKQYNIQTFPYVRFYDARGKIKTEGSPAYKALLQMAQ